MWDRDKTLIGKWIDELKEISHAVVVGQQLLNFFKSHYTRRWYLEADLFWLALIIVRYSRNRSQALASFSELNMPATVVQTLDAIFESTLFEIWLNGLYTALFILTLCGTYYRRRSRQENGIIIAVITIAMYILSTVHSSLHWNITRDAFVFEGSTVSSIAKTLQVPATWWIASSAAVFSANIFIADCLFIWRCWVIWDRNWWAVLPSILLTIVGTVFSVLADVSQITNIIQVESNLTTSKFFRNTGTAYLALSVTTTLIITGLITFRILRIQAMNREALGNQNDAEHSTEGSIMRVLEIVVESAFLYSISALVLLILLAKGDINYRFAQSVVSQVTGIAPTLILARIVLGFARPSTSWMRESSIVFTSGVPQSSTINGSHLEAAPMSSSAESVDKEK